LIHALTWQWGQKYGPHYAERLRNGVERFLPGARFLVAKPQREDEYLTRIPGCFARMRVFDPVWQAKNGIAEGDTIVNLDLDLVITRCLVGLFDRAEPFSILQGVNAANPCRYNGSVWTLRAGYRPDVWSEFTIEKAEAITVADFPDDQRWFEYMIPDAGAFGPADGVYGFCKPGWPAGPDLPKNARIVAFFGWRDPSKFTAIPWVYQSWR
jgi:hypothetical protein